MGPQPRKKKKKKMSDSQSNSDYSDEEFEDTKAGSLFYPKAAGQIRKGDYILIKEQYPCKVIDTSTPKTGKHGHAKARITCLDIFTGNKYEDICPSHHNINVPNVTRKDYNVMDVEGDYLTLLDGKVEKTDVRVPDSEIGKQLKEDFENEKDLVVTVIGAMKKQKVI